VDCSAREKKGNPSGIAGTKQALKEAQPHPIAHRELRLAMMSIIVLPGQLLCLEKTLARLSQDLIVGAE
jgi:hypothetical protein